LFKFSTMKKFFLIAYFVIVWLALPAQRLDSCYIDSKSKDTIRTTNWIHLASTSRYLVNIRMQRINSDFFLEVKCDFGQREPFSIHKKDSLWLKFDRFQTISLYVEYDAKSLIGGAKIPNDPAGTVTEGVKLRYCLSPQQFYFLKGHGVEILRFFTPWGYQDVETYDYANDASIKQAELLVKKVKRFPVLTKGTD